MTRISAQEESNSICYHAVREAVAMGELLTGTNPADILTKVVGGGIKRKNLVQMYHMMVGNYCPS